MTATEELRRLLDERGVEYDTHGERYGTWYDTPLGGRVYVAENNAGYLHVKSDAMTPEQAIAATLGRGTLTADDVRDLIERHSDASGGNGRDFHNGAYVAIADELNATLGRGTCQDLGGTGANGEQVFNCDKCGCVLSLYDRDGSNNLCTSFVFDYPRYCPECGRKVTT